MGRPSGLPVPSFRFANLVVRLPTIPFGDGMGRLLKNEGVHAMPQIHQAQCEPATEVQELRNKVEQAIVCLNAALYVLLQRTDTEKRKASEAEVGHDHA
jgi:hypothetical protein